MLITSGVYFIYQWPSQNVSYPCYRGRSPEFFATTRILAITCPSRTGDDYDYYIAIFPDAFQSDKHLLCTIIHEMAHAMDAATETTFQPAHSPRFKKAAKSLMRSLEKVPSALPTPFCTIKLDKNFILTRGTPLAE